MAKKRGNGEGSISQRPNGLWQGQVSLGKDDNGKTKRATFYGKTRRDVSEKIKTALNEQQNGEFIEKKSTTFDYCAQLWLDGKRTSLQTNTINKYCSLYDNHIKKILGNIKIQELTRKDIQKLITASSLSPKSLAEIHMIIKNILILAVEDNLIKKNVCSKIELPVITEKEITILTDEQTTAILAECFGTRIYDIVLLELATGMRRSEILGLTWDDIDFKNNKININKSWIVVNGIPQWSTTASGTKTKAGKRLIAVPEEAMDELAQRRVLQPDDVYVFQNKNGTPHNPNNFLRDFKTHAVKAGVDKFPFHSLRHNYGTQLAALNTHTRLIEAQLGHSDYRSSRRYIHATEKGQHEAAEKIGQVLRNIKLGCSTVAVQNKKDSIAEAKKP